MLWHKWEGARAEAVAGAPIFIMPSLKEASVELYKTKKERQFWQCCSNSEYMKKKSGFLLFRSVWSMRVSYMHPRLFVLNIGTDMLCLRCFVTHKDLLADAFWIHLSVLYPKTNSQSEVIRFDRWFIYIFRKSSRCCRPCTYVATFVVTPVCVTLIPPHPTQSHNRHQQPPPHAPHGNIDRLREWEWARETNSRKSFEVAFRRASLLAVSPRRVTFAERE